jgi:GAF domain-containing protein
MSNEVQIELVGLQNALLNTDGVQEFLQELAVLSTSLVAEGLSCGMSLRQGGRPPSASACSHSLAAAADEVQYRAGDGPCLYAMRHARSARVDDTAANQRWPRFCREAAALGIRSCYAMPLTADGEPVGALILYSRRPFAFGPDETRRAGKFAKHASGALTIALRMASCADLTDQLKSSIVSRAVIDQAIGVIMATQRCPQEQAFEILRSVSQNTNVKLRELAASIVTSVGGEPPRVTSSFVDD